MGEIDVRRIWDILHECVIAIEQIPLNRHRWKLGLIKVIRQPNNDCHDQWSTKHSTSKQTLHESRVPKDAKLYMGGLVASALSKPFSSGQTKSRPWETLVGNLVAHALGDRTARASGPSDAACGIRVHDPQPSKDHPWYEHCRFPSSSILPSYGPKEKTGFSSNTLDSSPFLPVVRFSIILE